MRGPVAAWTAFTSARIATKVPRSPTPPDAAEVGTMSTSVRGRLVHAHQPAVAEAKVGQLQNLAPWQADTSGRRDPVMGWHPINVARAVGIRWTVFRNLPLDTLLPEGDLQPENSMVRGPSRIPTQPFLR
jgi:hypothetical protein